MASKINKSQAYQIATAISDKAFEHLIKPLEAELNNFGKQAYDMLVEGVGGERVCAALCAYKCIDRTSSVSIDIDNASGSDTKIQYRVENDTLYHLGVRWNNPLIVNGTLYDRIVDTKKRRNELNNKKLDLFKTVEQQVAGKSPATVMKAWPEAAGMISTITDTPTENTLVTPLESLLARFLPMLPAPAPEM